MGLIPFDCIPKPNDVHHLVRVVFPDGRIGNLRRSCSVHEILHGNPGYFVCGRSAHSLTSRMGAHEQLERGFTYFICSYPNAPPFVDFPPKGPGSRAARATSTEILSRFFQARENRSSPTHHRGNSKAFDLHSAENQVENTKAGLLHQQRFHHLAVPKRARLSLFSECLQWFRLPRSGSAMFFSQPPSDQLAPPSPSPDEIEQVKSVLRSAARIELGVTVAKKQEFALQQRLSKPGKVMWKPWLQSIPENRAVVKFLLPAVAPQPQAQPEAQPQVRPVEEPRRFSPPGATRNISPPRRRPLRNISPPPRPVQATAQLPTAAWAPSPQQPEPEPEPQRKPKNMSEKPRAPMNNILSTTN